MIYHTSSQKQYYKDQFSWLSSKSEFVLLGVDYEYWKNKIYPGTKEKNSYIVCVGYRKRDWKTLLEAYDKAKIKEELYLIGNPNIKSENPKVKVLPFIPIEKLMTYIVNSRFSVIPLDDFNYSFAQLTLLQQMALGVPILAADVPAIRDYAKESKGVESYIPYSVENLREKLVGMSMKSETALAKMGEDNITAIKTTYPYITAVLSVDELGKYSFSLSIINYFALIAGLGVSSYAIREGARIRDDKKALSLFANQMLEINLISMCVAYVLLFVVLGVSITLVPYRSLIVFLSIQMLFTTIGVEWVYAIFEEYQYITIRSIILQAFPVFRMA